jgi:hypothetical protein
MKTFGRVIALVLLVAGVLPVVPAYGSTQSQPAGCHQHGQRVPAPVPVTYGCCRVGHQFAAVRELVSLRVPFMPVSRVDEFGVSWLPELVSHTWLKPLVSGSPGITSLRI